MQHSPFEIKERLLKALDKEYNVVDMAAVLEIVTILERTPITKEALETTRLGRDINELRRKTRNESLAKRTKDLVRRWRDLILPQSDAPTPDATHQNGASRPAAAATATAVPSRAVRTHPISPAISLPNSDKSSISPALSTRVEAVPRTNAANKRLRKDINIPIINEVKRSNESSPELPSKRIKLETQPIESQEIKPRINGDHYDSVSSDCEIVNFTPSIKQKNRKKAPKDRTQKESTSDDIVKEKIALIARVPKVKTTQELLAGLQSRSSDTPENSVNNPVVDHDVVKNKTEHIARFLRSQADNVEDIDEGKSPHSTEIPSITGSEAEAIPVIKEETQNDTQPCLRTTEEILARLPPIDYDSIKWDETPLPSPTTREVTDEDVHRVLNEHIEGVNGNYDVNGVFREWHEVVTRTSYNGELIHILPYVVID
ncbi:hypothetical protein O3M35_001943 [Rhynocoris fuscipes]|uniref:Mediator of RNA polymerase II transcription subunit 26 n=1 Tax=Rhynocoris fuscipes TaxID=488301 RepID=A0AAW1CWU0_9HEMI